MKNNKKIKKAVASIVACAVTCSVLPASESFAARNNNWSKPSVATGGAVDVQAPDTASHGAIGRGEWDFSDISSWMDRIDWDSIPWDSINWNDVNWDGIPWDSINWDDANWDDINWDDIDWDNISDMFPVTGGAIDGDFPHNDWSNIDWSNIYQRPVTTGGAIDTTKPEKEPSEDTQKPTTPDNGKDNTDEQKPGKDTTDVHNQPIATVTDGAVNAEVPDSKQPNNEQKPAENTVPSETVSNSAVTAPTKKKAKIKVSITRKKVKKGKKYKIKYSVVSGSGKVTFKSSNKKVATVNSKGVVTAKKKGTATITVKIANGNSKKVKITVK